MNVVTVPNGRDNNPDYMDMQIYDLPAGFLNQTLQTIKITDNRNPGVSAALVAGVTVDSTPEPGTLILFGSGIVGLAGIIRRKLNV